MKKWFNISPQLYRNFIICCNLVGPWEINRSKWHHGRMCPSRYFVTEPWKNLGVNLNKVVCLSWNLVPILIRIYRIRWWCSLFSDQKYLSKLCPKDQNFLFKLKFGTQINSNMQNSMDMFTFCLLDQKCLFWANSVQKIKIVCLCWNLVSTIMVIIFWDFLCSTKFFFHNKSSEAWLLVLNMLYASCLTKCQTT